MNHGQFDKADQLVAAVHRAEGGIFDGFRAAAHRRMATARNAR
jgi:hypothetical protein